MKSLMRKFIFIFLILIPIHGRGQEWSPIGAEWYYDVTYAFSGNIDYHKIYCDSIINVKGIDCKRININYCACNNHFCDKLFTYESNDTVFFYNSDIDSFQILYDFTAEKGDSWMINPKYQLDDYDTVIVYVDSVSIENLNGHDLKRLWVTYTYIHFWDNSEIGDFIEKSFITQVIGDNNLIINITDPSVGVCDMQFIHSLRCYQDSDFGLYTTNLRDSCNYEYIWTSVDDFEFNNTIDLFPNPANNYLTIKASGFRTMYYSIYNLNGTLIISGDNCNVNLSDIPDGIYIIKIKIDNQIITRKVIKHLL